MSNQLAFQLLAASNYIDALGGVSQSYRQALAAHEAAKPVAWLHPANASCVTTDPTAYARGIPLFAAPVAVASPWQPIETAPKDGEVLIYVTETDEQFVAYWDDGWRFSRNAKLKSPTHWQPLPPTPEMKP